MTGIYSLTPQTAEEYLINNGFRASQAANIFKDIYAGGACCFEDMKLTSEKIKKKLSEDFFFDALTIDSKSGNVDTVKYLYRLSDGNYIETVLMKQKFGNSICISTQCGCNMGCRFCCSGKLKKIRDLTVSEMVLQVLMTERSEGIKVTNITVMGIGEPFDNYENLCGFLDIACHPHGIAVGEGHVTVSTCGLADKIDRFSLRERPCNLAVSLHAPDDRLRSELMPINRRWELAAVMEAAKMYSERTNRRVLIEYVMLRGVNDSTDRARQLAQLIGDSSLFVNIIPYNPSKEDIFDRSSEESIRAFYDVLKKNNISVTRRREFGGELAAACGQLRSDRIKERAK